MPKILIIQFFINVLKREDFDEVKERIKTCKNEYLDHLKNENIQVVALTYQADEIDESKTIVLAEALEKGSLSNQWKPIDLTKLNGTITINDLGDPGKPETLTKIFNALDGHYKPETRILSTYDHGLGFTMTREPTILDQLKFFMSNANVRKIVEILKTNHDSGDGQITPDFAEGLERLSEYLSRTHHDGQSNIKLRFSSLDAVNKINEPAALSFEATDRDSGTVISTSGMTALTVNELRKAIVRSNFKKFDAIIMLNCFMQTADTAFALRKCCDYLLAAQTAHWFVGYDYAELMNLTELKEEFFQIFIDKTVEKLDKVNTDMSFDLAMSCLKLSESKKFFALLCDVIKQLKQLLKNKKLSKELVHTRATSVDLTTSAFESPDKYELHLVDLLRFLRTSTTEINDSKLNGLVNDLEKALVSIRKGHHTGGKYKSTTLDHANGISIFFPSRLDPSEDDSADLLTRYYYNVFMKEKALVPSPFAVYFGWRDFLYAYYQRIINLPD